VLPFLLRAGLPFSWLSMAAIALVLTAAAWRAWPAAMPPVPAGTPPQAGRLWPLYVCYGLCAFGLVPHMVFLVDFAVRGLGQTLTAGTGQWVLFGLGAACGPVLAGRLADHWGFAPVLRLIMLLDAGFIGALSLWPGLCLLSISAATVGSTLTAISAIAIGRLHELTGPDPRARVAGWSRATIAWALGQAVAAYGFAYIYAQTGRYGLLFGLAGGAVLLALVIDAAAGTRPA
jgi:predicted MFS family arabinose efflux permease